MSNLCTKQTRLLCHSRKTRRWLIYWEIEEIVVCASCFGLILAFAAGASIHTVHVLYFSFVLLQKRTVLDPSKYVCAGWEGLKESVLVKSTHAVALSLAPVDTCIAYMRAFQA